MPSRFSLRLWYAALLYSCNFRRPSGVLIFCKYLFLKISLNSTGLFLARCLLTCSALFPGFAAHHLRAASRRFPGFFRYPSLARTALHSRQMCLDLGQKDLMANHSTCFWQNLHPASAIHPRTALAKFRIGYACGLGSNSRFPSSSYFASSCLTRSREIPYSSPICW